MLSIFITSVISTAFANTAPYTENVIGRTNEIAGLDATIVEKTYTLRLNLEDCLKNFNRDTGACMIGDNFNPAILLLSGTPEPSDITRGALVELYIRDSNLKQVSEEEWHDTKHPVWSVTIQTLPYSGIYISAKTQDMFLKVKKEGKIRKATTRSVEEVLAKAFEIVPEMTSCFIIFDNLAAWDQTPNGLEIVKRSYRHLCEKAKGPVDPRSYEERVREERLRRYGF